MRVAPSTENSRVNHETRSRGASVPTVEQMVRHAQDACHAAGVHVSPSKVSKLARFYVREVAPRGHVSFSTWFVSQVAHGAHREMLSAELYRRFTYADPTGEQASKNVDRARKAGA